MDQSPGHDPANGPDQIANISAGLFHGVLAGSTTSQAVPLSANLLSSLEPGQSSHESSLHDVDVAPNTQAIRAPGKNRGKDIDEVHAELIYDLPPEAHPEFDVVNVSPNNALHLHLPSQAEVHITDPPTGPDDYLERSVSRSPSRDPAQADAPRPSFRVRFRSRVRIASGMHHHNHRSPYHSQPRRNSSGSVDSESSPCSSISAPLRYTPDDSETRPSYASPFETLLKAKRQRPRPRRPLAGAMLPLPSPRTRTRPKNNTIANASGERAPLLRAPSSRLGARTRRLYGDLNPDGGGDTSLPQHSRPSPVREDVDVFGSWPWRIFNGYWWAWKCGTISGCCCPADGDDDESEDEHEQRGGR